MQYRTFKNIGQDVSLLGVGAMRLPTLGENNQIDEAASIDIIRSSIDAGVNYVDTAYTYHGGNSEKIVGKALRDGYREKVILADKMPIWMAKDEEHMKQIFYKQLERLDTDYIDMYLVHSITVPGWRRVEKLHLMPFLEEMKTQGKIRHIGFSFHDSLEFFKEIVDKYPWEFCQIQLNYMDVNFQAGVAGLKYANEKGLDVIIMEPLKGGRLAGDIPPSVQKMFDEFPIKRSPAEWSFKWLASFPDVKLILSGMKAAEHVTENVRIMSAEDVGVLTEEENALLARVSAEYNKLIKYSCTECGYCMPCPQKLEIPKLIRYFNDWNLYGQNPASKREYDLWIAPGHHASDCVSCGACEEKCPQKLPIIQALKETAEAYGK